jgi:hypothetical protein
MNRLPTSLVYLMIVAFGLSCCDYQAQYRQIPFAVQQYFSDLPPWQKPKKIQIDPQHRKVYWLNRNGEIHAIQPDGTCTELVNKGIGATLGITYIGDFTLNSPDNTIYFTDLMDIASGCSAIKKSDLKGDNIETLATFSTEVPYAVTWDEASQQLYYLSRGRKTEQYSLKLLGESSPLATTPHKLTNIPGLLSELSIARMVHSSEPEGATMIVLKGAGETN